MSVEAAHDHGDLKDIGKSEEPSSTWNGRKVQHQPKDKRAILIQALALMHLAAQKKGPHAVRKLENEICILKDVVEKDKDDLGVRLSRCA